MKQVRHYISETKRCMSWVGAAICESLAALSAAIYEGLI